MTIFNHTYGLTVSGINYCQRDQTSPLENIEFIFGFNESRKTHRLGTEVQIDKAKCKRLNLQYGDCITSASIGGSFVIQRILANTKKQLQFTAGDAQLTIHNWGIFRSGEACMNGIYGLTLNSSLIQLGFYFNPEVLPDGKNYLPSGINIEKPFNPPEYIKANVTVPNNT